MESSGNHKINGNAEVDETVVVGHVERVLGRKNDKKKLVVFAIERSGKGVSRICGKVIQKSSSKELGNFMKTNIELDAQIKTDK